MNRLLKKEEASTISNSKNNMLQTFIKYSCFTYKKKKQKKINEINTKDLSSMTNILFDEKIQQQNEFFQKIAYFKNLVFGKQIPNKNVFYIGGSDVLPPPLNIEEEKECLDALSTEKDEEARKKLISHNLRLVVYLAKKFENTGVGVEDLISIGTIGLIKGIQTFNPQKNIKLATYASRCIENEILMYLRRTNKLKLEVSFDEPLNVDWDGNELLLSDILGTEEDIIYRDLETEAEIGLLRKAMEKLSDREREIVELRYGYNRKNEKEMTQKEVADLLGISQSYISRLEKKIMVRLKREIQKIE